MAEAATAVRHNTQFHFFSDVKQTWAWLAVNLFCKPRTVVKHLN